MKYVVKPSDHVCLLLTDCRIKLGLSEKVRPVEPGNLLSSPVPVLQVVVVDPEVWLLLFVVIICAHRYVPVAWEGDVALALKVMPGVPIGNPKSSSVPDVLLWICHCPSEGMETLTEVGPLMVNFAVAVAFWLWPVLSL
jgi:hypothetical protein